MAVATALTSYAKAQVTWNETTHDFGAFDEESGRVTFDFVYTNTGDEPVSIVSGRSSCGCTAPKFSTAAVPPGASGTVSVTYDPTGRPGRFSKYVAIVFSDESLHIKLYIKGTVVGSAASVGQRYPIKCGSRLRLNRDVAMHGTIKKGKAHATFLNFYNAGLDTITPTVRDVPPYMTAHFEQSAIAPGEQSALTLLFDSSRTPLYGLVADTLHVATSDGDVAIEVTANIEEDFSRLTPGQMAKAPFCRLSEESVDFGIIAREDAPQTRTVTLHNDGHNTLEIRRIYTTDPGVEVSCKATSVKSGKAASIDVTIDPTALPGSLLNARINIITNDPTTPVTVLRAVGSFRQ